MIQKGEEEEEEEDGAIVATLLTGIDAAEGTGVSQKDNEKSWNLSQSWAESISKGFIKCSSFILCQEPFLFSTKKTE